MTPPPAAGRSLRANIVASVLGNGVMNLCRFCVVALLAKFALPDIVGRYDYAHSVLSAPLVLFLALELRSAFVADVRNEFSFGAYRALRTCGMLLAAAILTGLILWREREAPVFAWMMLAVALARVAMQFAELYWGVFQRQERLDLMGWSNALRGITMLIPFAGLLPLARRDDAESLAQATLLATLIQIGCWLAIWWFLDRRHALADSSLDVTWRWPALARLAGRVFPLGLVMLIITLCDSAPRWFIAEQGARAEGLADLGYFGALKVITMAAGFLMIQVGSSAANRLAHGYAHDPAAFTRLTIKLVGVALGLGGALIGLTLLAGKPFLQAVYTPRYASYYPEFVILVCAQAITLLASVFGFIVTSMRRFWIQASMQVLVLAATLLAAWMLVPESPVRGGAWTALIRSATQAALYFGCLLVAMRSLRRPAPL